MKILIGADLVPTIGNIILFAQGEKQKLLGNELADVIDHADFRIFNLEVPLTDSDTPIVKEGPNLRAPTKCAQGFRSIGVDLFTLANNHILDQGEQGLRSTIQTLDHIGIHHVGAGLNLQEAEKPYYFVEKEKRYGIYACAEHEFSIAGKESPGANPFDPLETPDKIKEIKSGCDYLIVLYHGGKEHYRYPSPNLQRTCRKFIEKGADLVVCQHSHCIGCKEDYQNGIIVYGQGNFLFDSQSNEFWNTGLLLSISGEGDVGYIPLRKEGSVVRLAAGDDAEKILSEFRKRNSDIQREGFIDQQYLDFAKKSINDYLFFLTGISDNLIIRIANRLSGYRFQNGVARRYGRRVRTGLKNFIECEAHRELVLKGLEQQIAKPGKSESEEEKK